MGKKKRRHPDDDISFQDQVSTFEGDNTTFGEHPEEKNNADGDAENRSHEDRYSLEIEEGTVELLTILRHDLKNGIQVMTGYLQLLDETELDQDQKQLVEKTYLACNKTNELIDKIGFFKNILKRGDIQAVKLSVHIGNAIKKFDTRNKEFTIESELQEVEVKGYPFIEELFVYLIENALRHSRGTLVRLSLIDKGDKVTVVVEDDGIGIPIEIREDVFRAGYRGVGSTGFGLGLYLVDMIVKTCGGQVLIKENGLGGTRVEVTLEKF